MKRWLAVVTGSMGLVTLWALPPSRFEMPRKNESAEQLRYEAVDAELRRTHTALRALRWSDSLSALAIRSAVDGVVLSPPQAAGLEAAEVQAWEQAQRATIAALERRDPDMVVGIVWQPADHATVPGVPIAGATREMTFVGERSGRPYCIEAMPYIERGARALPRYRGARGACRLYAKYGAPGERIQAWLDASALGFARVAVPTFAADFARTALPPRPRGVMRLFGLSRPPLADQDLATQACLAGRASACERALTDPEVISAPFGDEAWLVANTPASSFGFGPSLGTPPFGYLDDGLLYELEARYGPDAFARFWTSTESVPEAFEAAFGEPLGTWVLRWIEGHVGLYRAGPSLPWGTLGWSLAALIAMAGVVTAAARRRRMG
ncbi:MAG TPA: hypothetical protein VM198_06975 [Longimicrobiales bacterium]|nr:hypothetical protein [Longimicrobiales bacterium]